MPVTKANRSRSIRYSDQCNARPLIHGLLVKGLPIHLAGYLNGYPFNMRVSHRL